MAAAMGCCEMHNWVIEFSVAVSKGCCNIV